MLWMAWIFLQFHKSGEELKEIVEQFEMKWHLSYCYGAIDGNHRQVLPRRRSGSRCFSCTKSHSVVFATVSDAGYESVLCATGNGGRISDEGVWNNKHSFITNLLMNRWIFVELKCATATVFWTMLSSVFTRLPCVQICWSLFHQKDPSNM
jgi:hypothetical protein